MGVPDAGSVVEDRVDKGLDTLLLCFDVGLLVSMKLKVRCSKIVFLCNIYLTTVDF